MAMVVAKRGKKFIKVSRRAYETLFRDKGYVVVQDDETGAHVEAAEVGEKEIPEDEEADEKGLDTIPISEMTKDQLLEYAKQKGIDTSGARNVREARQIIQKAIRESNM